MISRLHFIVKSNETVVFSKSSSAYDSLRSS